jgi:hypothetical protein
VGWVRTCESITDFGLQPTGIREDLQSWSLDLYILFMFFKDKNKNAKMEKAHKESWIYSLIKQTMMAISVQLNLVQKVIRATEGVRAYP